LHSKELHNFYSSPTYYADQIKENEVGGARGSHRTGEIMYKDFVKNPKERHHSEDRGLDEMMIILKFQSLGKYCKGKKKMNA
jgi:hypothetical protein